MSKREVDSDYLDMMIFNFNYSMDNNLSVVYLGHIETEEGIKEYWADKKDWIQTIDILLENAIELEEYEYCSQLKEIKEKLD
jgi:hypothetical protein